MSSHHFVREGQEPALLIHEALPQALTEPLLEWAPLVMVIDSALENVLLWGIKIDVVFVRIGEVNHWRESLADQAPIKIISYQPDEDPLETAFYFLISSKQQAVSILTRQPDWVISKSEILVTQLDVVLLSETVRWSVIRSGHFEKWVPANTKLFIQHRAPLDCKGLRLQNNTYEATREGLISIQSQAPFWVGETL